MSNRTRLNQLPVGRTLGFEYFNTQLSRILPTFHAAINHEMSNNLFRWKCNHSRIRLLSNLQVIIPIEDTFHLTAENNIFQLDYRIEPLNYIDDQPVLINVNGCVLPLQKVTLSNGDEIASVIHVPSVLSTLYCISKHDNVESVGQLTAELLIFKDTVEYLCRQSMLKDSGVYYSCFNDCLNLLSFKHSSSDVDFIRGSTNRDLIKQLKLSYGKLLRYNPKREVSMEYPESMSF